MPLIFWLDFAAYILVAVVAISLTLTALALGPKQALNRRFALFTLVVAVSALFMVVLRKRLWLQMGHPDFWLELYGLSFGLTAPILLTFAVRYAGRPTKRADLGAAVGFVSALALAIPLFRGQLISNAHLDPNGLLNYDLSTWGVMVAAIPVLYYGWALVLFWRERHRTAEHYMALSVFILVVGFVTGGILRPSSATGSSAGNFSTPSAPSPRNSSTKWNSARENWPAEALNWKPSARWDWSSSPSTI